VISALDLTSSVAILATTGIALINSPVADAAEKTIGLADKLDKLAASALLALVAIVALMFAFYVVHKLHTDLGKLIGELQQRPCIRKPQND